jgi:hypothetical protein
VSRHAYGHFALVVLRQSRRHRSGRAEGALAKAEGRLSYLHTSRGRMRTCSACPRPIRFTTHGRFCVISESRKSVQRSGRGSASLRNGPFGTTAAAFPSAFVALADTFCKSCPASYQTNCGRSWRFSRRPDDLDSANLRPTGPSST